MRFDLLFHPAESRTKSESRERDVDPASPDEALWPGKETLAELEGSAGQPLDPEMRRELEAALGHELDDVRIHTGSGAARAARHLSARAFTFGRNVYFGAGRYEPASTTGRMLVAHEVAHTVQQRGATTTGPLEISRPSDAHEAEAEAFASAFTGGRPHAVAQRVQPGIVSRAVVQRDVDPELERADREDRRRKWAAMLAWAEGRLAIAREATSGGGRQLPHLERIQQSFGHHDVTHVRAHDDTAAHDGAAMLGARAFAVGDAVAFRGTPDLHTAAHEAAHVVQQRAGLAHDDELERHADRVADAVVAGRSAEPLLDAVAARGGSPSLGLQRKEEQGQFAGNDLAISFELGDASFAFVIALTTTQRVVFGGRPDLMTRLAGDISYAFAPGGRMRFENPLFLQRAPVTDLIERDLDGWLEGKGLRLTNAFLDQRQSALSGLRYIAPLERWLAAQGVGAGTIDWVTVAPALLALPPRSTNTYLEASAEDRYRTFVQAVASEAANRPSVTGATATAARLEPLVRAYAAALPDEDFGNVIQTHSEAFLAKWSPQIAAVRFVPQDFDVERLRPSDSKASLESHRQRILADFKRTKMPNLIVEYVRDHWSLSGQTQDNYLKRLDMAQLKSFVVSEMADAFIRIAKTDENYKKALVSAARDQARYDSLRQLLVMAQRIETRNRDLPKRMAQKSVDDGDQEIADNPYGYLQTVSALAQMTTTIFSTAQRGGSVVAALSSVPNTPSNQMFGAVAGLIALGTAIQDFRKTSADQESATKRDLEHDLDLQYAEVAKIVQTMWDDAEAWINKVYIPKLKEVAIRILTQNRDELAAWDRDFATETPKVVANYKMAAFALRDLLKKLKSGEVSSATLQGHVFTIKDAKHLDDAASTMEALAKRLGSKDGADEKRKELRDAIAAFDRTKKRILDGDYPAWSWGRNVASKAREELGVGEFPEWSTYRDVFTGQVQASQNPFIARAIAGWQFREKLEAEFKQIAVMAGLGLLSVASLLVPGVGGLILTALDLAANIYTSKKAYDDAKSALDLALLDPHLQLQGMTVEQAKEAVHDAKIAFALSILIPLGIAAFTGLLVLGGRMISAGKAGARLQHLEALAKTNPVKAQELLEMIGDAEKLDKLLGLTKDVGLLERLMLHGENALNVERLLAKIKDPTKLAELLERAGSVKRLDSLLEHVDSVARLDSLAAKYGNKLGALEKDLVALAAHGDKASSGTRLDALINKVGGVDKLRPLLAAGGDLSKIEKLLETLKADVLTKLLAEVKSAEKLEQLLKHVSDIAQLERLLKAVKSADKLLELVKDIKPASLEKILAHTSDAAHAGDLIKAYGHTAADIAKLETHLASLGNDANAGRRLAGLLGHTKDVATLDKLLAKAHGDIAGLEKLLALGKAKDVGAVERLLSHAKVKDLAQLASLSEHSKISDLAAIERLLGSTKVSDAAQLQRLLDSPILGHVTQLEHVLGNAKIVDGAQLEHIVALVDDGARLEHLIGATHDGAQLLEFLTKAGGSTQAARLERLIAIAVGRDAARLTQIMDISAGNASKFEELFQWTQRLERRAAKPPVTPPPQVAAHGFVGADMSHFLDHTWEYCEIQARLNKAETTFWREGTTPAQIRQYLGEALDSLNPPGGPRLPVPNQPSLAGSTGGQVRVGSLNSGMVRMFYPIQGEKVVKAEMRAIGRVLLP